MLENYQADVTNGPVYPKYHKNVPNWIVEGGYFLRKSHESGELLPIATTNNTAVRRSVFKSVGHLFCPEYGVTGGGDSEFFFRVREAGCKIVWVEDAVAWEFIPEARHSLKLLIKRRVRVGQSRVRILYGARISKESAPFIFKSLVRVFVTFIKVVLFFFSGKAKYVKYLLELSKHVGGLSAFSGLYYKECKS